VEDSQVRGVSHLSAAYFIVGRLVRWMAVVVDFLLKVMVFGGTMESCFAVD